MKFKGIHLAVALFAALVAIALLPSPTAFAQTVISGAVSGIITDPTGAAIPGASITVTETTTGTTHVVKTGAAGQFRVPFLPPGPYSVTVVAAGFQKTLANTNVAIGETATVNVKLPLAKGTQTVQVQANAIPLLQTQNSSLSTTLSENVVQNVPNPGSDITYPINLTQGVVMNTQGGYGNSSAFGLPATSNNFTINGAQDNDPFLNLNNSGPSNMLLGSNDVSQINVVANAYGAQYGGFGGVQENIVTRSGTNKFHGNVNYFWTNSDINANDWFNDNSGAAQAYSNANQFAAALGGPIVKTKLFFFVNFEGLRFVTAPTDTVFVPTAGYEADVLKQLQSSNPAEIPFYNKIFKLYNGAPGAALARPFPGTTYTSPFTGVSQSYMNYFQSTPKNNLVENLFTARVDANLGPNDNMYVHFKRDHGVQPTDVDPINSAFNMQSDQPDYEGQLEETHTFSPNLVNQFLMAGAWYSAIFKSANPSLELSTFPYTLEFAASFSNLGGIDAFFPQGRNVTQYQFDDDVSWTIGKNSVKFGGIFKRDDVTDYDLGVLSQAPLAIELGPGFGPLSANDLFSQGQMYLGIKNFPTRASAPIALYQLGLYLQDQYRPAENFQVTGGIRIEHNSNPVCQVNCFGRFAGSYQSVNAALNQPYNKIIATGLHQAFPSLQAISVQPRVGFTWSPKNHMHTVLRGGFGLFSDVFPATVADSLLTNPPLNPEFAAGGLTDPSQPGSFTQSLSQANQAFVNGFASGGSFDTISATNSNFVQPNIFTADPNIHYPTYEEWSLQVQQQLGRNVSFQVGYVGNHGENEPVVNNGVNISEATSASTFNGLPQNPALPSFAGVSVVQSAAISNYSGLVSSVKYQSPIITGQINYTWSHALDEISNGGFLPFGGNTTSPIDPFNLRLQNYGNADYDLRNNMNAFYVIHVPHFGGPKLLTANWLVSGTIFWHSGFPFSVTDANATNSLNATGNYGGTMLADIYSSANLVHNCGKSAINTPCFGPWAGATDANGNPVVNANFQDPTGFGGQRRNQFFGPGYFDTDFAIMKGFPIPHVEGGLVRIGAQAYNVFNHPNFANPNANFDSPQFGTITSTVSTPTSAYGSFLGGDASPRIVQLKATITF